MSLLSCHAHVVGKWDRPSGDPHPAGPEPAVWPRIPRPGRPLRFGLGRAVELSSQAKPPATRRRVPNRRGDANIAAEEEARINDRIRAREVLLIAEDGEQLGVRPLPQALALAREAELDLVEVAPNAKPPVCKIMDFRRYQYEQQQRRKESRKKATNVVVKEMKYRPKIDIHDYTTKTKKVQQFLGEGHKVKVTIMFRGREMAHPELGRKILDRLAVDVGEIAIVESAPRQDGRNMTMVLHPLKQQKPKPVKPPKPKSETPAETPDAVEKTEAVAPAVAEAPAPRAPEAQASEPEAEAVTSVADAPEPEPAAGA